MGIEVKLSGVPSSPGVYLMKGAGGQILYIGKARCLSDRVRTYFQKGAAMTPKVRSMVEQVRDIEYLVTLNELEALILENSLVKKHQPKYNVLLRDDKNYPFLRLPVRDDYPRLQIVRRVKRDGALYFGPYVPTNALRETLRVLRRVFPLPNCKIRMDGKAERACIEFEIKRCLAPCTGNQTREQYRAMIDQVRMFLEGKDRELVDQLRAQMEHEADRLNFEEAARLRDTISKVERTLEKQRVSSTDLSDQDVLSVAREGEAADLQALFVRGGLLIGRKDFFFEGVANLTDADLCASFIQQFYAKEEMIPRRILLSDKVGDKDLLEKWLSERRGGPVRLHAPVKGPDAQLLKLASENAVLRLRERLGMREGSREGVREIQALLGLRRSPRRIEAFDISNIQGDQAVGSMVVWEEKGMKRSDYRRFRIKTVEGANDFAMMEEVLYRQYSRVKGRGEQLPDLVLIDGGKGQLSAAKEVLDGLGLSEIDVIGLAKARDEKDERVFVPGVSDPIPLPAASPGRRLLQMIRDEAHRFAVTYHRKLRGQDLVRSILDEIDGIGEARKRALLRHFGGLERIREASLEELEKVPELGRVMARRIYGLLSAGAQDR